MRSCLRPSTTIALARAELDSLSLNFRSSTSKRRFKTRKGRIRTRRTRVASGRRCCGDCRGDWWSRAGNLVGSWASGPRIELGYLRRRFFFRACRSRFRRSLSASRSEEHTSELQSLAYLVCRLLLEKKKQLIKYLLLYSNKKKKNI